MANMTTKPLTEEEIDNIVITQADDDSAWEDPIFVKVKPLPRRAGATVNYL